MSDETTPAVERATEAVHDFEWTQDAISDHSREIAEASLTAALDDPDDPDMLARTLFVLHHSRALTPELALIHWDARAETHRAEWRAVADGLRMMLTGSGS